MKVVSASKSDETIDADYPGKYAIKKITMTGFITQEVEDAAKRSGYNFSGVTAPAKDNPHYSLRYSEFVVLIAKVVQVQQVEIGSLQNSTINITEQQKQEIHLLKEQIADLILEMNLLKKQFPVTTTGNKKQPF